MARLRRVSDSKVGSGIFVSPEPPEEALRLRRTEASVGGVRKLKSPPSVQPSRRALCMASFPSIFSNRATLLVLLRPSLSALDEFPIRTLELLR